MDTLRVSRLQVRYRLPASRRAERDRLGRVLRAMLDESLALALERAGLDGRDEICIRRVHVPARLRMGLSDAGIGTAWSLALADSIRNTVVRGGPGVARYRSRAHALADLLAGVATGDLRRAWAWRQLGLWGASDDASSAAAGEAAARALVSAPSAIVPALAVAARGGILPRLLREIPEAGWIAVARAALEGLGGGGDATALLGSAPSRSQIDGSGAGGGRADSLAQRVLRASELARAGAVGARDRTVRVLAILAVLEVEPAALRREDVAFGAVDRVERGLRAVAAGRDAARADHGGIDREPAAGEARPDAALDVAAGSTPRPAAGPTIAESDRVEPVDGRGTLHVPHDEADSESSDHAGRSADEPQPLLWPRVTGETRWAGLLFLLNVVTELGIPDEISRSESIGPESFRWLMHRLAMALVPVEERDPAALAFAGLAPDTLAPEAQEPSSRRESSSQQQSSFQQLAPAAVRMLADRITHRLAERLGLEPPADPRAAAALLRRVCRRRGTIVADPGWLEVRLAMDEVSTDVRRAGLDLDPGWLPWLGVVVRFVYE